MKTKIILAGLLLVFSAFSLFFTIKNEADVKTSNIGSNTTITSDTAPFLIGAYDLGNLNDYSKIDSLRFNAWHQYLMISDSSEILGKWVVRGWFPSDTLFNDLPNNNDVKSLLDANNAHNLKMIMQRPATQYFSYGQRSDYECEESLANNDFWFYTYRNHPSNVSSDYTETLSNETIKGRYCRQGNDSGYVMTGLKANREQINCTSYPGGGDVNKKWYIKPRIKIDSASAYANHRVCRVEVYRYDSTRIKTIEITGNNFIKPGPIFDSSYLDWFYGFYDTVQTIADGRSFNPDTLSWFGDKDACKVDFRVFWYGECDMWIDRIRVEDEIAHSLFDPLDPNYNRVQAYIGVEAKLMATHNTAPLRYYLDEFEFNHLPCIKYVSKMLKDSTSFYGREIPFTAYNGLSFYSAHIPSDSASLGGWHFGKYFLDSVNIREFNYGEYPFKYRRENDSVYTPTIIPSSLPRTSGDGVYGEVVSPRVYENWLQNYLYYDNYSYTCSGLFINTLKDVVERCKESNWKINFTTPVQTHIMRKGDYLREPT